MSIVYHNSAVGMRHGRSRGHMAQMIDEEEKSRHPARSTVLRCYFSVLSHTARNDLHNDRPTRCIMGSIIPRARNNNVVALQFTGSSMMVDKILSSYLI